MNNETKQKVPFNLERFKSGQKALTREGHVATFVAICEKCENFYRLLVLIEGDDQVTSYSLNGEMHNCIGTYSASRYDLVSMISRHQHLIDAWHKGASIEGRLTPYSEWIYVQHPSWYEDKEYRIKPEPVIHCLAYNTRVFKKDGTGLATPKVVTKDIAQSNGWKIIQEWEV